MVTGSKRGLLSNSACYVCGLFLWEGHHVHVCEVYCHGVLGQCEVTTINGGERQQQLLQEA